MSGSRLFLSVFFGGVFPVSALNCLQGALWSSFPAADAGDVTPAVTYQSTGYLGPGLLVTNVWLSLQFCGKRGLSDVIPLRSYICNRVFVLCSRPPCLPPLVKKRARSFSRAELFSPQRSELLLFKINLFLRPSWLFPVCIQALLNITPSR